MEASSSATSTAASSVVVVAAAVVAATGAAATLEVAEGSLASVAVTAFFAEEAFFAFTGAADAVEAEAASTTTGTEVVVFDALVTAGVVVEVDFAILFLICLSLSYNLLEDLLFKCFNAKI